MFRLRQRTQEGGTLRTKRPGQCRRIFGVDERGSPSATT